MQRIQPELKRLQAKYKDDRTKLNEEMMKFYKENKVNPVAGCLPLLLQTPLFIVLYRLILGLTHKPAPKHVPVSSDLYRSLVQSGGKMVSWGIDLAQSASTQKGFGKAWPFYILIALTIASGFYQQRQMTARMPAGAANAQMKMIGRVFPIMIGLISFRIPAGVVVYFIISNIWQIAQQDITFRTLGPATGGPPAKTDKDEGEGKGGKVGGKGRPTPSGGGKPKLGRGGKPAKPVRKSILGRAQPPKQGGKPQSPSSKPASQSRPASQSKQPPSSRSVPKPPAKPAKGKRPPPSPRPKGLPEAGPAQNGQAGPTAKNTPPRKDT
jgi:YidC/Oxa1 family membrane protein insertase